MTSTTPSLQDYHDLTGTWLQANQPSLSTGLYQPNLNQLWSGTEESPLYSICWITRRTDETSGFWDLRCQPSDVLGSWKFLPKYFKRAKRGIRLVMVCLDLRLSRSDVMWTAWTSPYQRRLEMSFACDEWGVICEFLFLKKSISLDHGISYSLFFSFEDLCYSLFLNSA